MNPAKIQTVEQFKNFVREFDHELRSQPLNNELRKAYEEYQNSPDFKYHIFFKWNFKWCLHAINRVSEATRRAIGELKLYFSLGNDSNLCHNKQLEKHLSEKRKWIHQKGKFIKEDCQKISSILQSFESKSTKPAEQVFIEKLKSLYIQKFKQIGELVDDSLFSENKFFDIVKKDFSNIENDLAKLQQRYVRILKYQTPLDPSGSSLDKQNPHDFSIQKYVLINHDLCLTAEKEKIFDTLKEKVLRNELSSNKSEKETHLKVIDGLILKNLNDTKQKIDNQKVIKHKNIHRHDDYALRQAKLNTSIQSSWTLTPAGRILNETSIPDYKLRGAENKNDFEVTIDALKRVRYQLKQKLHFVRKDLLNLDNKNPKAAQKKLIELEDAIKHESLSIYQAFLNKMIDLVGDCQLLKRQRKESIDLR